MVSALDYFLFSAHGLRARTGLKLARSIQSQRGFLFWIRMVW
jgi:hypothetical protein